MIQFKTLDLTRCHNNDALRYLPLVSDYLTIIRYFYIIYFRFFTQTRIKTEKTIIVYYLFIIYSERQRHVMSVGEGILRAPLSSVRPPPVSVEPSRVKTRLSEIKKKLRRLRLLLR